MKNLCLFLIIFVENKFQETNRKFQETDKKLRKLKELFVGQWGKLGESLVEGSIARLFNQKGINVQQTFQRSVSTKTGKEVEIDIIASNGEDVVAVEVKTTL